MTGFPSTFGYPPLFSTAGFFFHPAVFFFPSQLFSLLNFHKEFYFKNTWYWKRSHDTFLSNSKPSISKSAATTKQFVRDRSDVRTWPMPDQNQLRSKREEATNTPKNCFHMSLQRCLLSSTQTREETFQTKAVPLSLQTRGTHQLQFELNAQIMREEEARKGKLGKSNADVNN